MIAVWSLPRLANRYRTPASRIASSTTLPVVRASSANRITLRRRARPAIPDPVPDRQQRPAAPGGQLAPDPAGYGQHHRDRHGPDRDEVPGAVASELLLHGEEDDRADDRPFHRAQAADDHHEQHVRAVVDVEHGAGVGVERADDEDAAH